MKRAICTLLTSILCALAFAQEPVFRSSVKVVVINVTVTTRDSKPLDKLTKDDFQVFEDGKLQRLQTAELQHLETTPLPALDVTGFAARTPPKRSAEPSKSIDPAEALTRFQDKRLMVMLFDFSSMQPAEQVRSVDAARKFIATQLTASDMVSIMVFSSALRTVQDFTNDRELLVSTIKGFHIGEGSELAGLADTGADAEDQSGAYVADDTEFNIFNTDRKLAALEDAARKLAPYPEKKALVYFSSGVEKTGVDNQSQLRATINTAVRANVSFYPIDARGLTASAPGGDASKAAAPGSSLFSGRGQRALRDSFQNQQETLYSLAADTGGKALLDSNDLTVGLRQVQQDVSNYYVLAYSSTNSEEDGRFRKVQVKLAPRFSATKAKLDYRPGYFAPATFARMTGSDKESQLQQALESGNPVTDLPMAVEIDYFRLAKGKYFVPVTVKIPGAALSFRSKGAKAATELDFIAQVREEKGRAVSAVRDTIPLKLDQNTAAQVGQKQIQYDTGLTLAPGKYTLRFVARENGAGKTGTFEAPFVIPDLSSGGALRLSSVILSNQREPVKAQLAAAEKDKKLLASNPLIDSGMKLVPNVTRAFRPGQNLFAYLEIYDPPAPISIAAEVSLYQGNRKVLSSSPARGSRLSNRGENVLPLQMQLALRDIAPGQYTCQVTLIDETGKKFAFPRSSIVVLPSSGA